MTQVRQSDASDAREALRELKSLGWGQSAPLAIAQLEELIRAAQTVGYPALPSILGYALHAEVGNLAVAGVLDILHSATPMQRLWVERRVRRTSGWVRYAQRRTGFGPPRVARRLDDPMLAAMFDEEIPPEGWWLLSMSPDGHLRQRAVLQLSQMQDVTSLAHLILRTLDWVAPVRSAALTATSWGIKSASAEDLVDLVPLAVHLLEGTIQREGHGEINRLTRLAPSVMSEIMSALDSHLARRALVSAVATESPREARACFRLSQALAPPEDDVLAVALASDDVVLQGAALTRMSFLNRSDYGAVLRLSLGSKFSDIRKRALQDYSKLFPDDARDAIIEALFDRSESVRALARFLIGQRGEEPSPYYRGALTGGGDSRRIAAALFGLADIEHDWVVAEDYLRDPRASIRSAAVAAIARSDKEAAFEILPPLLGDDTPGVSAAAARGLTNRGAIDHSLLEEHLRDARPHVVRNAARLVPQTNTWPWLAAAFELAASQEHLRSQIGVALVLRWCDRRYLPQEPPPDPIVKRLEAVVTLVPVLPGVVLESFQRHGLVLPLPTNLTFGSADTLDLTAGKLAAITHRRFDTRYSSNRGGRYRYSGLAHDRSSEVITVQHNADPDRMATQGLPYFPVLVYVDMTRRTSALTDTLTANGLVSIRRPDVAVVPGAAD